MGFFSSRKAEDNDNYQVAIGVGSEKSSVVQVIRSRFVSSSYSFPFPSSYDRHHLLCSFHIISTAEKARSEKTHKFHFLPAYLLLKPSQHMFPSSRVPCPHRIKPSARVYLTTLTNAHFRQSLRRQRPTVHLRQRFLPSVLNPRSHLYTPKPIASIPTLPHRGKTLIPSRKNRLPASDHRISY